MEERASRSETVKTEKTLLLMMAETSAVERENYTKVVMQKTLCVPLLTNWEQR